MTITQTYERVGTTYMTPEYYQYLLANDLLVDGSAGGLMVGPSIYQGGIQPIYFNQDAEIIVPDKTEGWHFIINAWAETDNRVEIKSLSPTSAFSDAFFKPYEVPSDIDVINIEPREVEGILVTPYLFFGTNFVAIARKEVAKQNLIRLTEMNRVAWQKHFIEAKPKETIRESAFVARFTPRGEN